MAYIKNNDVEVRNLDNGKLITCRIVDATDTQVWVRLPTKTVVQFSRNPKTGKFCAVLARLDLELV